MGGSQQASSGRDAVQVSHNGDGNIHIELGDRSTSDQASEANPSSPMSYKTKILIGVGILLLAIVGPCLPQHKSQQKGIPFIDPGDPWPVGSTLQSIAAPILAKLQSCAMATATKPITCPQVADSAEDQVTDVRWKLIGDPIDGARPSFHAGRFDVIGHAVMTVTYSEPLLGPRYELHQIRYRATVAWNNGAPTLEGTLGQTDIEPKKPIRKQTPPADVLTQARPAVQQAFSDCIAATRAPLPPTCPQDPQNAMPIKNARWSFDGDPLQNTEVKFDASWGLIHLRGNFALKVSYRLLLSGERSNPMNGVYDAVLSPDGPKVKVLQIGKL